MNSSTQIENQRRRLPEDKEVHPQGSCSGKGRGRTCWSSLGWLCQSLVQRGVRWRRWLKDIHFHDFEGCIPKKAKNVLWSRVFLCSFSGNLFWSIYCNGRFANYKCNDMTNTLIWAQYLLLSAIKYSPQWPFLSVVTYFFSTSYNPLLNPWSRSLFFVNTAQSLFILLPEMQHSFCGD